jgi:predicted dehydrogenase
MANWWVPGLAIGYDASFTHQVADFIQGLETGKPAAPTFRDAYETQLILDAVLDSAKGKKWVNVPKG